jgi:hypothetical protein
MAGQFALGYKLTWLARLSRAIIFEGKVWALQTQAKPAPGNTLTANTFVSEKQKLLVLETHGRLPLYFIANQGQVDRRVKYYVRGGGLKARLPRDFSLRSE